MRPLFSVNFNIFHKNAVENVEKPSVPFRELFRGPEDFTVMPALGCGEPFIIAPIYKDVAKGFPVKFSINKGELQNALAVVSKGISTRSTLPSLAGVFVKAQGNEITLETTNLDLSIRHTVMALVEEEGTGLLPGKLFGDIVKSLPDAAVTVSATFEEAYITCDKASFALRALNPQDFPGFPHVETSQEISVDFPVFSSMVKKVARNVSRDESRPILTGVLVNFEGGRLRMVATDSYRLAITDVNIPETQAEDFECVISGSFMLDLAGLPRTEDPITLALAENQILVRCGTTVFVNRRIEGQYPPYQKLLPEGHGTRAKISVSDLAASVKRASLMGNSSSPVRFDLNIPSQTVQVSAMTQDVGSAKEIVSATIEGEDMEIAFNFAYTLEGLAGIAGDEAFLELQSPTKPGILRAIEPENYLYLIMPVRIP